MTPTPRQILMALENPKRRPRTLSAMARDALEHARRSKKKAAGVHQRPFPSAPKSSQEDPAT